MIHSYDIDDAIAHGVTSAVLLYNIKHWVAKNRANQRHFHDGRHWTYNSVAAFCELFPEFTQDQIRRSLEKLVSAGVLLCGNYSDKKYDRTRWYSLAAIGNGAEYIGQETQIHMANLPNVYKETDINTDKETVKKPDADKSATLSTRKKKITLSEWIESERSDGRKLLSSDDPIFDDGIPRPYIALAWKVFSESQVASEKRQIDWRQTFRNYVRGDYLKLWAITRDGVHFLTTAGKQNAIRFDMGELVNG